LEPDKEINGLTFGGVGSGTEVEFVQVSYSNRAFTIKFIGGRVTIFRSGSTLDNRSFCLVYTSITADNLSSGEKAASLIIEPGAKIMAEGTVDKPIVFTSDNLPELSPLNSSEVVLPYSVPGPPSITGLFVWFTDQRSDIRWCR